MQRAFNKEREQKETAKIKKIEDSSKWSLKTVFPSRQLVKAAEPALGYSEINGAAVQGRRGFGEFAKKDAEKEEIDNSDKRDNEQDINSSQDKKPLKKRKANEKGARGFKGISNLFN